MAEEFNVQFYGFWREEMKEYTPPQPGIYCVYECTHDEEEDKLDLHRLLYIGESDDMRKAINDSQKINEWKKSLEKGDQLCFSAGIAKPEEVRKRMHAAYVFRMKPPLNEQPRGPFPFPSTRVIAGGAVEKLIFDFTIEENAEAS